MLYRAAAPKQRPATTQLTTICADIFFSRLEGASCSEYAASHSSRAKSIIGRIGNKLRRLTKESTEALVVYPLFIAVSVRVATDLSSSGRMSAAALFGG